MDWRLRIYEFLAAPAHVWLHIVARLCGGKFECGPVEHPDDPLDSGGKLMPRKPAKRKTRSKR